MNTKILIAFIGIVLVSGSCKDEGGGCCVNLGYDLIEFGLKNQDGEDLLNPDTDGTYNTSKIAVFEYTEGEYRKISAADPYFPRGYTILDSYEDRGYRIRMHLEEYDMYGNNIRKQAIIKWNDTDQDTVVVRSIETYPNVYYPEKILYNLELVWDANTTTDFDHRYFEIVK